MRRIQIRHENMPPSEFDLYDLVLRGDKTKDIRLQQGDTIFIPAAGPQVALAGSVRHPAIYELREETTPTDLVQLAGGYTSTAMRGSLSLERIDQDLTRKAMSVSMDSAGSSMALRDGDVLFVNHISQGYDKSVTIRGNLANPGRFSWHPGMHLSEIIPDTMSLLTGDYWQERNRLGIPTPSFEPQNDNRFRLIFPQTGPNSSLSSTNGLSTRGDNQNNFDNQIITDGAAASPQNTQTSTSSDLAPATLFTQGGQSATNSGNTGISTVSASTLPVPNRTDTEMTRTDPQFDPKSSNDRAKNKVQIPAPEIDWSYAVIERLDPRTLKSALLPFNLGRLVQDHDHSQDSELQPGDVVTILSQADISVSLDEQTKYVRLEGEFLSSGVYSVLPGEDLESLVRRAGGLTDKAYLYGSSFMRESARVFQQQRLNEYISSLSVDMERSAAVRAASSSSGILDPNMLNEQRTLVAQLRQLRATGRVVLEFQPTSAGIDSIPHVPLENGDVFRVLRLDRVPSRCWQPVREASRRRPPVR